MQQSKYMIELRSAIIAGVVAMVVAAPLSTAATHEVVQIVKGKQGKRGPRGFRGPQGSPGAQGPQGVPGPAFAPKPAFADFGAKFILPGQTITVIEGGCNGRFITGGTETLGDTSFPDPGLVVEDKGADARTGTFYFAVIHNPTHSLARASVTPTCP